MTWRVFVGQFLHQHEGGHASVPENNPAVLQFGSSCAYAFKRAMFLYHVFTFGNTAYSGWHPRTPVTVFTGPIQHFVSTTRKRVPFPRDF